MTRNIVCSVWEVVAIIVFNPILSIIVFLIGPAMYFFTGGGFEELMLSIFLFACFGIIAVLKTRIEESRKLNVFWETFINFVCAICLGIGSILLYLGAGEQNLIIIIMVIALVFLGTQTIVFMGWLNLIDN